MMVKVFTLALVGAVFVVGSMGHNAEYFAGVEKQCLPVEEKLGNPSSEATQKAVKICWLDQLGFVNENGEFNKVKINEVFKSGFDASATREVVLEGYTECTDKATGQTKEEKLNSFVDCTNTNEKAKRLNEIMKL